MVTAVTCLDLLTIVRFLSAVQERPALSSRQVLLMRWHVATCRVCFDDTRSLHDPDHTSTYCAELFLLPFAVARRGRDALERLAADLPECTPDALAALANDLSDDHLRQLEQHREQCQRCRRWEPVVARAFLPASAPPTAEPQQPAGDPSRAPRFCSAPAFGERVLVALNAGASLEPGLNEHCDACAACWIERADAPSVSTPELGGAPPREEEPATAIRPSASAGWRRYTPLLLAAALVLMALLLSLLRPPSPSPILLQSARAPQVREAARALLRQPWRESVTAADPTLRRDVEALLALLDSDAETLDRAWVSALAARLKASELAGSELRYELERLAEQR